MIEIWRDVPGFETLYKVSNFGRIRSCDRVYEQNRPYRNQRKIIGKILKLQIKRGYPSVILIKNNIKYTRLVHRIVALAFIPNPSKKPQIDHINTIRTDNRVENLRWCTASENSNNPLTRKNKSMALTGRTGLRGAEHPESKEVICLNTGNHYPNSMEAGRELNISGPGIRRVCRGERKTYKGMKFAFA